MVADSTGQPGGAGGDSAPRIDPHRRPGLLAGVGLLLAGGGAWYLDRVVLGWSLVFLAGVAAGYLGGRDGQDGLQTAFYAVVPALTIAAAATLAYVVVAGGMSGLSVTVGLVLAVVVVQYGVLASVPVLAGGALGGYVRRRFGGPLDAAPRTTRPD